jgi:hypothetical protein
MQKQRKPMYLLSYDHGGFILWGDQFEEKIDSAVDWLEKYPKFRIGLDNECFAYDEYARSNPAIIAKINDVLGRFKGRFGIGSCTYGQPLSVFISEESNTRQIVYAIRANLKHFGQTPVYYAISEHALHNQIPQLAKQAGYQGAIMRTHFMMYGYNPTYDAPFGRWFGEDGTAIPTVPTYDGEGADFGITTLDNWVLTRWPDRTTHSLEEFGEKFRHIEPLLASRYDDIVHRHEGLLMYVEDFDEYQWVLLEDLPGIYGQSGADCKDSGGPRDTRGFEDFRPTSSDFRVRMPWGYCGNEIFNGCSAAETAVTLAERANAAAVLLGGTSLQPELEEAWKNLLISQHHDIQICGLLKDSRKYLPASSALSAKVSGESMSYLASQFATEGDYNLVLYNPHSFDITSLVELELPLRGVAGCLVSLDAEPVPSELLVYDSSRRGINRALVRFEAALPAATVQVYHLDGSLSAAGQEDLYHYDRDSGVLETPLYSLSLDKGGIRRFFDKENGALLIDDSRGRLFSGVINDIEEHSAGKWSVSLSPNSAKLMYGGIIGDIPLLFEMNLYGRRRRIDCKVRFVHNGEKIGRIDIPGKVNGFVHENKLRFVLNTRLEEDSYALRDLPYVIVQDTPPDIPPRLQSQDPRTTGKNSRAAEPLFLQGNYWMARRGADFGLALFNRGCRGAVADGPEFSLPLVYANTYIWGTRMLYGETSHEFAVYPFAASIPPVEIHKQALAYHYPPLSTLTGAHRGRFSVRRRILDIKGGDGVIMTALYPEDGAVLLRSCEYRGIEEAYEPGCPDGKLGGQVTIMNKPVDKPLEGKIGPWEIRTHRIYPRSCSQT